MVRRDPSGPRRKSIVAPKGHASADADDVKRIYMHQASPRLVDAVSNYLVSDCKVSADSSMTSRVGPTEMRCCSA